MTAPQTIALVVLVAVVAALIHGRMRPEIAAMAGAAILLITRTIRPTEVEGAFASPAIIALASWWYSHLRKTRAARRTAASMNGQVDDGGISGPLEP